MKFGMSMKVVFLLKAGNKQLILLFKLEISILGRFASVFFLKNSGTKGPPFWRLRD